VQNIAERQIPLEATSLADDPPYIFPIPLDLSSIEQLLTVFEHLVVQTKEEVEDDSTPRNPNLSLPGRPKSDEPSELYRTPDSSGPGLGANDPGTTSSCASGHAASLSPNDPNSEKLGGER
jgi:hypothetical protein